MRFWLDLRRRCIPGFCRGLRACCLRRLGLLRLSLLLRLGLARRNGLTGLGRSALLARGLYLCLGRGLSGAFRFFLTGEELNVSRDKQDHDTEDEDRFTYLHLASLSVP